MAAASRVQVGSKGNGKNHQGVGQVLELQDRYPLGALEGQWAYVDVLLVSALLHKLHGDVGKLIGGVRDLYPHHLAALEQALVVLSGPEYVHLLLLGIPVATYAFEYGGAVMEGVGHYPYLGL